MTDQIDPTRPKRRYEVHATVPNLGTRQHVIKAHSQDQAKEKMVRAYATHDLSADACWANPMPRIAA